MTSYPRTPYQLQLHPSTQDLSLGPDALFFDFTDPVKTYRLSNDRLWFVPQQPTGRTLAQLQAAPTPQDVASGNHTIFYQIGARATLYRVSDDGLSYTALAGGGGSTTYAGLTDKATVDLTSVNTPLKTALAALQASISTNSGSISTINGELNVQPLNAQTGTSYQLVLSDAGSNVDMNNAAANTVFIPPNSEVPFPLYTLVTVTQAGTGTTSIAPSADAETVTIVKPTSRTLSISAQLETAQLYKIATNTWRVLAN
jgi:hypothetical protein